MAIKEDYIPGEVAYPITRKNHSKVAGITLSGTLPASWSFPGMHRLAGFASFCLRCKLHRS